MTQIREEILISVFEETFSDKVQRTYDESSSKYFIGCRYSMEYNFLEGHISLYKWPKRIGAIFISDDDIFSKVNTPSEFIYYVGLFEHKLKKFIKSNKRKTRRKFISW